MTTDEVILKLKSDANRAAVARATGLRYQYLCRIAWGMLKNPGAKQVDVLRDYYANQTKQ